MESAMDHPFLSKCYQRFWGFHHNQQRTNPLEIKVLISNIIGDGIKVLKNSFGKFVRSDVMSMLMKLSMKILLAINLGGLDWSLFEG
jgi:hypothetical protein